MEIPKIIHQIWLQGKDVIPEKYIPKIDNIKKLHPNWEYKIWDEKSFLQLLQKTPEFIEKYNLFKHLHQKIDFAKIIILWHYGGVFLDIDVEGIQSMNKLMPELSDYDFVISYLTKKDKFVFYNLFICENFINCYNNGIFISKPKADILYYLATNFKTSFFIPIKMLEIHYTTGPIIFNRLINSYENDTSIKNKSKIKSLDNEYFEPCIIKTCDITENTYIKHEHDRTWFNGPATIITEIYDYNSYLFWALVLFFFIFIFMIIHFFMSKKSSYSFYKISKIFGKIKTKN